MIEQIKDLPPNMVGFHAIGVVRKKDFKKVFAKVKRQVSRSGKLNYLLYLDTSPSDFTIGAWLKDAILGLKYIMKWNRIAIVTDSDSVIRFTKVFSVLMPGEFKGFNKNDMLNAIGWVSGKKQLIY